MASSSESPFTAADPTGVVRAPSAEQQQVLDRIAAQRVRLRARRNAMAQSRALVSHSPDAGSGIDDSLVLRGVGFAREHPLVVAVLAGIGLMAGPRRLIRWAGVVLPLVMKLRR